MASSTDFTFVVIKEQDLNDDILEDAAKLFSENYGVWQSNGKRVRMSVDKLKSMLIPSVGACEVFYVRAFNGEELAGHAFACRWKVGEERICWITQLVVAKSCRRKGLATTMLRKLRENHPTDWAFGLLSSHPAAVRATLRAFDRGLDDVNLDIIREHASTIMASSPVDYVRNAKFRGSLFEKVEDGTVSSADTAFFVDHTEPFEALKSVRDKGNPWPFGELLDGHEFLVLVTP